MRKETYPTTADASTLGRELDESLDALSFAIHEQGSANGPELDRAVVAWLNFIRPLGITITIAAAADWCVITGVICQAYPGSFPDMATARRMLRDAGIDVSVGALRDYARLMDAVGERLGMRERAA